MISTNRVRRAKKNRNDGGATGAMAAASRSPRQSYAPASVSRASASRGGGRDDDGGGRAASSSSSPAADRGGMAGRKSIKAKQRRSSHLSGDVTDTKDRMVDYDTLLKEEVTRLEKTDSTWSHPMGEFATYAREVEARRDVDCILQREKVSGEWGVVLCTRGSTHCLCEQWTHRPGCSCLLLG